MLKLGVTMVTEASGAARQRAERALTGAGLPAHTPLVRASSQANEAWLGDGFVLRVNARGDLGRLAREAKIAAGLPPEVRYPGVCAQGDDGEIEWIVVRRVVGVDLSRAWPDLDARARERATRELAEALCALHAVDGRDLPGDAELHPPHTLPLAPLLDLLQRTRLAGVDGALLDEVEAFVRSRWAAFDDEPGGLVHGDPHLENVLWDGAHVSALLDFEWSRRSWPEVDLEILLSVCDHPFVFVSEDYEAWAHSADYAEMPRWLRQAYPGWFSHPRCADRLALLHISRTLGILCEHPELGAKDPGNPRDRRQHLRAVLDGSSFLTDRSP